MKRAVLASDMLMAFRRRMEWRGAIELVLVSKVTEVGDVVGQPVEPGSCSLRSALLGGEPGVSACGKGERL